MEFLHYPVMHKEVLENLTIDKDADSLLIDCTTGEGGHTKLFLDTYPRLKVIGLGIRRSRRRQSRDSATMEIGSLL